MWQFFLQTIPSEPVILPDSVQKANFEEAYNKLMNLDAQQLFSDLMNELIWIGLKLLVALFIFLIGRWLIRRVVKLLNRAFESREVDLTLRTFIRGTVTVALTLLLLLFVVQTLGVNITSLIAVFSAATLAIGMALSGTAQNFAGGVMILMVKPYRVGDYITAQGQSGTVREIKLFSTVITTVDNQTIYIPNNVIATGIIDNYSTATTRRTDWSLTLSYGDDVGRVRKAILAMFEADQRILKEPAAVVWVSSLDESCVCLTVRAWVQNSDLWDVFFEYNERFYNELPKEGVHFPFRQLDVHIKNN